MTIIGLAGAIGSGKSLTQLKYGLRQCEMKQKLLVTNFQLNLKELYKYCRMCGYDWLAQQVLFDRVTWIINPQKRVTDSRGRVSTQPNLEAMMIPESIVLLDEAGIVLNSRNFANTSMQLLADLCQSRKMGTDLIWAAQFLEQVDKQVRLLTQYWVHCKSISTYDKKSRRPKLKWKRIYYFDAFTYNAWLQNTRDYSSHLKTRFAYAFDYEGGLLSASDRQLFNVYQSFSRLDLEEQSDHVRSLQTCARRQRPKYATAKLDCSAETLELLSELNSDSLTHSLSHLPPAPPNPPQPRSGGGDVGGLDPILAFLSN